MLRWHVQQGIHDITLSSAPASGTAIAITRHHDMMALRATEPSLCMNCVHSGHCVFERTSPTAVLQCDEHLMKAGAPAPTVVPQPPIWTAPTGLCVNCDHVKSCGLRSPERIVLHCEHYE